MSGTDGTPPGDSGKGDPGKTDPGLAAPDQSAPVQGTPVAGAPDQDRTVITPAPVDADKTVMPTQTLRPTGELRSLQPGDVLNHIFEVKRLIGRGGMGEVYEGININSEERVAIKVILPHLAADPQIKAMFFKEARTLTRLSHPALVQYRVLAQEPELQSFYIVTQFVDGRNLSDVLGTIEATEADMRGLLMRLAEGLAAAHSLGAIHRDISPDNVMLEDGRLDRAKIIDFGIAKDLDASTGTIIGTGFAGKLNYVAPEQLGDFNRNVGPWSDVYSLGLVILAVARRRDVEMGTNLVEAVDKRRAGPDLSPIPARLRPIVEKMTKANPTERVRSMEDVIALVQGAAGAAAGGARQAQAKAQAAAGGSSRRGTMIGGGVAAAVLLAGGAYFLTRPAGDAANVAKSVLTAGLGGARCSWLDVLDAKSVGGSVNVFLRGVAGAPEEIKASISRLLDNQGLKAGALDFNDVFAIGPNYCTAIDAFRQIRDPKQHRIDVSQREYVMGVIGQGADKEAGKRGSPVVITANLNDIDGEIALAGIEQDGKMTLIARSKADITSAGEQTSPGVYQFTLNTTEAGWKGIVMLWGKGPFDEAALDGGNEVHNDAWSGRFLGAARNGNWKSDMIWYRVVDNK